MPVSEYIRVQGRFRYLDDGMVKQNLELIDEKWHESIKESEGPK